MTTETFFNDQNAKKGMSDSPVLVDFAWVIEFSFLIAQRTSDSFAGNLNYRRTLINPGHQQMFFRLVKMTIGLVHASYSLSKWQAVKLTLFAPLSYIDYLMHLQTLVDSYGQHESVVLKILPEHIAPENPGLHMQSKLPDDVSMHRPSLRHGLGEHPSRFSA